MRRWILRKEKGHCTDWRDGDTKTGKDAQQVRTMKDKDGKVMTDEESVLRIWKEYYKGLMDEENERDGENDGERVNLEMKKISKEEVRET